MRKTFRPSRQSLADISAEDLVEDIKLFWRTEKRAEQFVRPLAGA